MSTRFIFLLFLPLSLFAQIAPPPMPSIKPMAGCELPDLTDLPAETYLEYLKGKTFNDLKSISCDGSIGFADTQYRIIPNNIYQVYSLHPKAILVTHDKVKRGRSNYEFRNIRNERIGEGYARLLNYSANEDRENLVLQTDTGPNRRYVVCRPDGTQEIAFGKEARVNITGDYISVLRGSVYDIYSTHNLDYVATGTAYPVATTVSYGRNGARHRFYVSAGTHTFELDRWGKKLRDLPFSMVEPIWYNARRIRSASRNDFLGYRVTDGAGGFTVLAQNLRDTIVAPFPYRVQGQTSGSTLYPFLKDGKFGLVDANAKVIIEPLYEDIKYLSAEKLIQLSVDPITFEYINFAGEKVALPK